MENIIIKIATEFTDSPGARFITDGAFSGEEFYNTLLKPRFIQAKSEGKKLFIDLDGSWGYASSFISGSFGVLATEFGKNTSWDLLELKSEDDPSQIDKIKAEINKSSNNA